MRQPRPMKPEAMLSKDVRTGTSGSVDFSHRHFAFIAAEVRAELDAARSAEDIGGCDRLGALAERFASALASTNQRFDRARFLRACGVVR